MTDETRTRFLAAIARQLPPDKVAEVHLFPAIKQGGIESGVAVIALKAEGQAVRPAEGGDEGSPLAPEIDEARAAEDDDGRFTVYSATYRHTLKGMDRGKWEVTVVEEADAPLVTVDAVVRGVQRRSGDVDDSHRLSGDEFRAALPAASP